MDNITTKCPDRSPLCIAEALKEIISHKTVCDIGCREGDIMIAFSQYADKVIGIDWNEHNVIKTQEKGLNVIMQSYANYDLPFPEADVYYVWIGRNANLEVLKRIESGIVILGGDPSVGEKYPEIGGEVIRIKYNEGERERQNGIFELTVINKNPKKEEIKDEPRKEETVDLVRVTNSQPDAVVVRVPAKPVKSDGKKHRGRPRGRRK